MARKIHWSFETFRFLRSCVFSVLSVGPVPKHIAFIMDGNRRFAKKRNQPSGAGHEAGFLALIYIVVCCYELGAKYVTAYAFSIDNFKRNPEEVESFMTLMKEKIEMLIRDDSIVHLYKFRVHFSGNLKLLSEPVRNSAERLMACTKDYSNIVLTLCVAYTSTNEIMHSIQESCEEKRDQKRATNPDGDARCGITCQDGNAVKLVDIEKHMYMSLAPDPDILIRTSGENRLSNFLLWQSARSHLLNFRALWPEIGFWHLVWAVLNFQQKHVYLEKKQKQL